MLLLTSNPCRCSSVASVRRLLHVQRSGDMVGALRVRSRSKFHDSRQYQKPTPWQPPATAPLIGPSRCGRRKRIPANTLGLAGFGALGDGFLEDGAEFGCWHLPARVQIGAQLGAGGVSIGCGRNQSSHRATTRLRRNPHRPIVSRDPTWMPRDDLCLPFPGTGQAVKQEWRRRDAARGIVGRHVMRDGRV